MKKFLSVSLILGLFAAIVAIGGTSGTNAQSAGLMSSILNRMERQKQSLKTLSADISMWKYNSQLRDEEKYSGVLKYVPAANAFVYLEWNKPQHEILVTANGDYWLYRPRLGIVYVGKTNSIKNRNDSDILALLSMSAAQLRTKFGEAQEIRDETLYGGVGTTHFKVSPKGPASYRHIELWVDKEGMPVQTKMVEKNDDSTTVRLTNVEKNQTIPHDIFTLKLNPSVKRVKG